MEKSTGEYKFNTKKKKKKSVRKSWKLGSPFFSSSFASPSQTGCVEQRVGGEQLRQVRDVRQAAAHVPGQKQVNAMQSCCLCLWCSAAGSQLPDNHLTNKQYDLPHI